MSKDIINEADELQEDPVLDETEDTLEPEVASTEAEVENTLSEEPEGETNEEKQKIRWNRKKRQKRRSLLLSGKL